MQGARIKLVATDGVFSMDGHVAPLLDIVALARKYGAYTFIGGCGQMGFGFLPFSPISPSCKLLGEYEGRASETPSLVGGREGALEATDVALARKCGGRAWDGGAALWESFQAA